MTVHRSIKKHMSKEIEADYAVQYLLPRAIEDWVGEDHPARFIREFVDSLDLDALGFARRESADGRPNYSASLMLKVCIYAYMNGIIHLRDIERACREHMSLIWLTGNNWPDHTTIGRFMAANGEAIRKIFGSVVRTARGAGLVGTVLHAVDGTKIKAKSSKKNVANREELERLLRELEKRADEMIECAREEMEEEGEGYRLPAELAKKGELRRRVAEALREMEEAGRDKLNPDEPEARLMKSGGKTDLAYNAQAVVDADSGLIVAEDVVSDEIDKAGLVPMLEEVERNLGSVADENVADNGYCSSRGLMEAERKSYSVLVNMSGRSGGTGDGEFHSSKFEYDPEKDLMICPIGAGLEFQYVDRSSGQPRRVYRCGDFRSCPRRHECSRSERGRTIKIGEGYPALVRQRKKQEHPSSRALLGKRKAIVERVFGHVKQNMGFRRWTYKGIEKVKTQWALVCAAVNLRKLHRIWVEGALILNYP
jgi:transposase